LVDRAEGHHAGRYDAVMPEMSPVQQQLDAFNAHDLDGFIACYASDVVVRHGDGREILKGHDGMRGFYGPFINDPKLHAEVVNRLHSGDWIVDEEHTVWTGGDVQALVAYEVRDGLIHTMVMLGGPV
jgi:hypothetical protein